MGNILDSGCCLGIDARFSGGQAFILGIIEAIGNFERKLFAVPGFAGEGLAWG